MEDFLDEVKSADTIVDKSVIRVGMATITASLCVQCLGVCIDRHIDMKKQVSQTISACSFYLRNINRVVNAIITSRFDYCNALSYLYSLTKPCTTTRQCICVNSCPRINRQEHCALRAITCLLGVKRTRTKAGDCSFAVAAASLWNNLPTVIKTCDNLTSFKRLLKTHFCRIAY
ncbi:hypothetical protein NP493_1457g00010 [Ridgeia piscesae]|uniref:Uncharacterized protein n=1 Tax=Ridgeia piscesae TaxID=27915 RepID=A0AAD9NCV3_RIDPI|nr:hypothetical protein NP493_1457g00010 [Ridgeia piscesae]